MGRCLDIAMGSASELEDHLLLAHDLGRRKEDAYQNLNAETTRVKHILASLINRLTKSNPPKPPTTDLDPTEDGE